MSTKARVILTAAFGVVLGLHAWLGTEGFSPSPGLEEVFGSEAADSAIYWSSILVPLIVGRWWVLAALGGRFAAQAILLSTGHTETGDLVWEPAIAGPIVVLVYWAVVFLILVGIRKAFDRWRRHRATRKPLDARPVVSNSSDS